MKTRLLIFLFILSGYASIFAQTETDSVSIHFRVSKTEYDPDYKGNRHVLDSIFSKLTSDSLSGPTHRLMHVRVTGAASPEGSVEFNRYLSEKRAEAIFNEFRKKGFLNDTTASFTFLGRDWNGLRRMVEKDSLVPEREDVLELLSSITGDNPPVHPLASLKKLHGGRPYQYMLDQIFPLLRESNLIAEYERLYPHIKMPDIELSAPEMIAEINGEILPLPYNRLGTVKECRPFYMGLKTNLLYDALLLPNVGAEFYIGKN